MWESVSNFLSCNSKKKRAYESIVHPTNGHMSARTTEELEPMIRAKQDYPGRPVQSGNNRIFLLCCACCGCLSAALVALLLVLAYVMSATSMEVENTKFGFWDYYLPQFRYFLAGQSDTTSWSQWYEDLAGKQSGAPMVADGLGPNTRTHYGWQAVRDRLEDFAVRIRDGTVRRHNELGLMLLSDALWPETGGAVTGFSNSDHAAVRPYLGSSLDGAEGPWDKNCQGATCWNEAWLRKAFKERFSRLDTFSREDLVWMASAVLHKVQLNMDLSDDELKDFASMQQQLVKAAPFDNNWFWNMVVGIQDVLPAKQRYEEMYREAIKRKWPKEEWENEPMKLAVLASAMLDSLALIGGSALATTLDFLLALMHMDGEPGRSIRPVNFDNDAQLSNFIWETLRRYPPIVAVPRWVTEDGQMTWKHEVLSLYQALHDPSFFPDPLEYRLGRPGLNHEDSTLSVGFADVATVNGDVSDPGSHSCPAKQLTFRLITAFLREFQAAGPWKADSTGITLNSYGSSGFVLRKER